MNCSKARELLANYHELQKAKADVLPALEEHLEDCAACREVQQQIDFVGESIRSLPSLSPSPVAHSKLMRALAAEHTRYIQRNASSDISTPTPAFLKPYLKDLSAKEKRLESLTAFSSAETGPLPIIPMARKRPRLARMSHASIVGIAAAVLMLIMVGGISSLVLMAQFNNGSPQQGSTLPPVSVQVPTQITVALTNTTQSPYTHVVSAIANRNTLYYSAYEEDATTSTTDNIQPGWMLEKLDLNSQGKQAEPIPLLDKASTSKLYILECINDWLIWLQQDAPKTSQGKSSDATTQDSLLTHTWSIHALYLGTDPSQTGQDKNTKDAKNEKNQTNTNEPITLLKGTYDQSTLPLWVNSPLQGTSTYENNLLVTWLDAQGTSHLTHYQLDPEKEPASEELAKAEGGHILTSPTASSNGMSIYWGEEWATEDNVLHGNIWQDQQKEAAPQRGRWTPHNQTFQSLFRADGASFHPQVVKNTLFILSTLPVDEINTIKPSPSATSGTATATVTPTPTHTPKPSPTVTSSATPTATMTPAQSPVIAKNDPSSYPLPADAKVQGTLLGYQISDPTTPQQFGTEGQSMMPQAGDRFLIWENKENKAINMFDVQTNSPVNVNSAIPSDTLFLSVHGDTAVWITPPDQNNTTNSQPTGTITFKTFNWPTKVKSQPTQTP